MDNYGVIGKDRTRNVGGVCLYLRSSINYKILSDLVPSNIEAVCVEITQPHSQAFIVSSIYRPPDVNSEYFAHLENFIKLLDDQNKEIYMLGDFISNMLHKNRYNAQTKKLVSLYELIPVNTIDRKTH